MNLLFAVLLGPHRRPSQVVAPENDVLRGSGDRAAAGRREDIVRREHQLPRFHLGLYRERHVHGHLVTVEVRVVSGTNERVDADCLTFNQLRLKGLDRETVECRRAVE